MISLNLLPDEIKREIAFSKKNAKLRELLFKLLALAFLLFVFMAILGFYLKMNQSFVEEEKESVTAELSEMSKGENEARDLYERLELVRSVNGSKTDWSLVLATLAKNVPANLMIDSIDLPQDTSKRAKLTGKALSDKDISIFRDLLNASGVFKYVDIESITDGSDPVSQDRRVRDFVLSLSFDYNGVKK